MVDFYKMWQLLETSSQDWWTGMSNVAKSSPSSTSIYDQLTLRDRESVLDQQYQQFQQHEQKYKQFVDQMKNDLKGKGYNITDDGTWVHVEMKYEQKYGANWSGQAPVEAFKTYRTFVQSPQNLVVNYLKALQSFADVLQNLQDGDQNYKDRMQFKFPSKLRTLFYHPDSLVVHWRNRYNRNRINNAIDQHFSQAGVQFSSRGSRAEAGYDFRDSGDTKGGSHSEIISILLQKTLEANPQYKQLNDDQFKQWYSGWLNYFNKLSPELAWQYINMNPNDYKQAISKLAQS